MVSELEDGLITNHGKCPCPCLFFTEIFFVEKKCFSEEKECLLYRRRRGIIAAKWKILNLITGTVQ